MEAQLVVEASVDQFAFRHALTQQVVYNDLLTRERAALHRAIAYQSEQLFAEALEGHLADLARHFYEAGEWAKALEYAKQAGARAQALYAPRAAAEQFTRALSAAQHLHLPAPEGLLRARGQAYEMLGEFTLAQADFEQALDQAIVEHDQTAEWHALVCLGMLWAGRDYQKTGEYYRRALALAEAMGDMAGIAETCDFLEMAYLLGSDLIKCNEYGQRAIALYRAGDQRAGMSSCLATLSITALAYQSNTLTPARSLSAAQGYGEEALRIARAIAYRSGEAFAAFSLGCVLGPQGKWSATLQTMHNSLAIAEEIEHRQWTCAALTGLNCVYDDLLDQDTARRYGERALEIARTIGSAHW